MPIEYSQYAGLSPQQVYALNPNGLPVGFNWSSYQAAQPAGSTWATANLSAPTVTIGNGQQVDPWSYEAWQWNNSPSNPASTPPMIPPSYAPPRTSGSSAPAPYAPPPPGVDPNPGFGPPPPTSDPNPGFGPPPPIQQPPTPTAAPAPETAPSSPSQPTTRPTTQPESAGVGGVGLDGGRYTGPSSTNPILIADTTNVPVVSQPVFGTPKAGGNAVTNAMYKARTKNDPWNSY